MRHGDTYRGARKRQAKWERILWRNVPFYRVTLHAADPKKTGVAFRMKMVPSAIATATP